jgi:hypothetical protein
MADLFHMTSPLTIRAPDGRRSIMAEYFRHPQGLLYFDLYWHLGRPEETMHLIEGGISGEGPWKIGGHVVHVLGCHGSDGELAAAFSQWQTYLETAADEYPPPPLIAAIARRMGAITDPREES